MVRPIAITCGDPSGVGLEVIAQALGRVRFDARDFCLIGPKVWVEGLAQAYGVHCESVGADDFVVQPGVPSLEGAQLAYAAVEQAAQGCKDGRYAAVVTAPVSKSLDAESWV